MSNAELSQYRDEYIIDAFVDNYVHILELDAIDNQVIYKMYQHVRKILTIECEIRDIKVSRLIDQAIAVNEFNRTLVKLKNVM